MTLCAPCVKTRHLADDFCPQPCDRGHDEEQEERFGTSVRQSEGRLSQPVSKNQRKKNPPKSPCVRPLTYLFVTESSHLFSCCGRLTLDPLLRPAAPSPICFNTSTSDKLFSLLFSPGKTHPASVETALVSIVFPSSLCPPAAPSQALPRLHGRTPPLLCPSPCDLCFFPSPPSPAVGFFVAGLNKKKLKGAGGKCLSVCLPLARPSASCAAHQAGRGRALWSDSPLSPSLVFSFLFLF